VRTPPRRSELEPRPAPDYLPGLALLVLHFALLVGVVIVAYRVARPHLTRRRVAAIFRYALLTLVYAAVAVMVVDVFLTRWGFGGDASPRGLRAMLAGEAERPFAYRVLTPRVIATLSDVLANPITRDNERWLLKRTPVKRYAREKESWDLRKAVEYQVGFGVLFAALLGAIFAARALSSAVYRGPPWLVDYAPAGAALLLPLTFVRGGYVYDLPELLFLFLCVLCIVKGRLGLYYPLFVLACFNKESNALIVLYFLAWGVWNLQPRRVLAHFGVQLLIGAVIVVGLRIAFRDAPGSPTWFFGPANVLFLLRPATWWATFAAYGPIVPFPLAFNGLMLFLVGFAVCWRFMEKPIEVRGMLLLVSLVLLPLYAAFGFLDEIRALSILFPALYLTGFHTLRDLYGRALVAGGAHGV
jgi:hypothetical protein